MCLETVVIQEMLDNVAELIWFDNQLFHSDFLQSY